MNQFFLNGSGSADGGLFIPSDALRDSDGNIVRDSDGNIVRVNI